MATTAYKIVKGSIKEEVTNVDHVKRITMTVIPSESITTSKVVEARTVTFKWNNVTGCPVMNEKILAAINASEPASQSTDELEIIAGLELL